MYAKYNIIRVANEVSSRIGTDLLHLCGRKVAGFYSSGRAPDLGLLKAGRRGCLQYVFLSCLGPGAS